MLSWLYCVVISVTTANRWCAFFSKRIFLNNRKCCKNIKLTFWSTTLLRDDSACSTDFYGTISNVMFTTPATITLLLLPSIVCYKSFLLILVSLNLCQAKNNILLSLQMYLENNNFLRSTFSVFNIYLWHYILTSNHFEKLTYKTSINFNQLLSYIQDS